MGKQNKGRPARCYENNGKKDANVKPKQIDDSGMESGMVSDMETDTVAPWERQVKLPALATIYYLFLHWPVVIYKTSI